MLSGEQDVLLNALLSDSVVVGNVFFLCKYIEREKEGRRNTNTQTDIGSQSVQ